MIVFIDNYDSFVYNLVQYVGSIYKNIKVFRNNEITVGEIKKLKPYGIIISPGPGWPKDAGISEEVIKELHTEIPILGVCLGHQAIGEVFGGKIIHAKRILHGKTSTIIHSEKDIFKNIPNPFKATRYHSLVIDYNSLHPDLEIIARSEDDEIMAIKHKNYPLFGVQFHPESISTENGMMIIKNFIDIVKPIRISLSTIIEKISSRENLSEIEAKTIASEMMEGEISPAIASSILIGLKTKGEVSDEIYGFARSMIEHSVKINVEGDFVLDNCGTGGDGKNTFNISTISSFVIAGTEKIKVPKHGNRSVSSKVGSADLLEALGVKIDLDPWKMEKIINTIGIGFLFAPIYHPAMRNIAPIRKELGVKTIFNILGPLTNPSRPKYQLIGVFSEKLLKTLPEVIIKLGVEKAFVVHSEDGLDEVSPCAYTKIAYISNGQVRYVKVKPEDFGFKPLPPESILGGSLEYNKNLALDILSDKDIPQKVPVIMNASMSILLTGIAKNLEDAVKIAIDSISSGKALEKLEKLRELTNK